MPVLLLEQPTPARSATRSSRRRVQAVVFGIMLLGAACAGPTEPRTPRPATPSFDGGTTPTDTTTGRSNYSLPHG